MAFSLNDLNALEAAISQGALSVKYADKEVVYRSLSEMLQIRQMMREELNPTANNSGRKYGSFSKGLK